MAADGKRYDVLPGGRPGLAAPEFRVRVENGQLHASGSVRSMQELRRLTRRLFKKHGIRPDRLDALAATRTELIAPTVEFDVRMPVEAKRAIAKMAGNLLAAHHRELFVGPEFDCVRRYVAEGIGDYVAVCPAVNDQAGLGDFDHLVLVSGSASTGEVRALVVLYGHLHFVVDLGTTALLSDIRLSYRVDPVGRQERRHADDDSSLEVPPFAPDDGPQGEVWAASVTKLINTTFRYVEFSRAVEECWAEAFSGKPEGEEITEQEIGVFSHLVMERVIPRFYTIRTRR